MKRTKKTKLGKMRILTNDPSLTAWGWVVLDSVGVIEDCGVISTKKGGKKNRIRAGDDLTRRFGELASELNRILDKYSINYILSELPHGSQSYHGAIMIGSTAGILSTFSVSYGLPIEWYSEGDAKKQLLGKINASKSDTIKKVKTLYEVPWAGTKKENEAIADALAIHNVAVNQSPTLRFLKDN